MIPIDEHFEAPLVSLIPPYPRSFSFIFRFFKFFLALFAHGLGEEWME